MTSPGAYDHSVFDTFMQLTERRSARDLPKQPPATNKSQWPPTFCMLPIYSCFLCTTAYFTLWRGCFLWNFHQSSHSSHLCPTALSHSGVGDFTRALFAHFVLGLLVTDGFFFFSSHLISVPSLPLLPVWAYCPARSQDLLPSSILDLVIPLTLIHPFSIRRCRPLSSFFTHVVLT